MALPIRPNSGATPASKPAVRRPAPKASAEPDFSLPPLDDLAAPTPHVKKPPVRSPRPAAKAPKPAAEPVIEPEDELEEGWAIDEKTGVKYKTIPKSVYKGKGKTAIPLLAIEDFDADNMTGEAETYLGHLRIPPDKEEQERLKQLRAQLRKRSDQEYAQANKDELENTDEDIEADAPKKSVKAGPEKKTFAQKLADLFR